MRKLRFVGPLLLPSVGSLVFTMLLAVTILGTAAWAFYSKSGILYTYLFGPNSAPELIQSSRSTLEAFSNTVFGNPTLNKVLFFVFWLIVGLIVYTIVTGLGNYFGEVREVIIESHYINAPKGTTRQHAILRLLLRIIGFSLVFIYLVFFYNIFLPFSILSSRIGLGHLSSLYGWLYLAIAYVELVLSLHVLLILLRFTALRPRLIASADEATIEDAEANRAK